MALQAVVYQQDFLGYNGSKDLYNLLGGNWGYVDDSLGLEKGHDKGYSFGDQAETFLHGHSYWNNNTSSSSPPLMEPNFNEFNYHPNNSSSDNFNNNNGSSTVLEDAVPSMDTSSSFMPTRPKRRRAKSRKNKEEIENQRMTHIAVERNRRKQMNEYLAVLRSLMPDSYVQRGDQASIVGGAINFVKEMEHRLQLLGAKKEVKENSETGSPFTEFFTFPQYSTSSSYSRSDTNSVANMSETAASEEIQPSIADIEVNMVESHANLKIRSKRWPKQLLKLVAGLHSMRLTVLHLNVTTAEEIVLYTLSCKVEDDCKLTSGDDIATAVYQLLRRIQEDALLN